MTVDVNSWNNFLATGKSSDGSIHNDGNGLPQMQIYPSPSLAPGNFGMLASTTRPTMPTPSRAGLTTACRPRT